MGGSVKAKGESERERERETGGGGLLVPPPELVVRVGLERTE